MDAAIVVALIALAGTILNTAIALYGQSQSGKRAERREFEATLRKYRDPLFSAAFDLQSRLYNILEQDFLGKYYVDEGAGKRDTAVQSTLFMFGQFFAWTEILRRELQFLDLRSPAATRQTADLQGQIVEVFASDKAFLGPEFMIWRPDQRAIGEEMTVAREGKLTSLGYAEFCKKDDASFRAWFVPLERDLEVVAQNGSERLRHVQRLLVDLIAQLDPTYLRYSGRLTQVPVSTSLDLGAASRTL